MDLKGRIKELCVIKGISMNQLEQEFGYGKGYISKLGKSTPNATKIQQLATRLGTSVEYLMTGNEEHKTAEQAINPTTEKDIAAKINDIIGDINDIEGSPIYYDGIELDEKSKEIAANFFTALKQQMEMVSEMNKKNRL